MNLPQMTPEITPPLKPPFQATDRLTTAIQRAEKLLSYLHLRVRFLNVASQIRCEAETPTTA
jgi:hypothetical protein